MTSWIQRRLPRPMSEEREALSSANVAKTALPSAERNNPESVAELRTQAAEGKDEARRLFEFALELVDSDTDRAALNDVRYFMSWLYWEDGDYLRAAVLSDFLARRYPEHRTARRRRELRCLVRAVGAAGIGQE